MSSQFGKVHTCSNIKEFLKCSMAASASFFLGGGGGKRDKNMGGGQKLKKCEKHKKIAIFMLKLSNGLILTHFELF